MCRLILPVHVHVNAHAHVHVQAHLARARLAVQDDALGRFDTNVLVELWVGQWQLDSLLHLLYLLLQPTCHESKRPSGMGMGGEGRRRETDGWAWARGQRAAGGTRRAALVVAHWSSRRRGARRVQTQGVELSSKEGWGLAHVPMSAYDSVGALSTFITETIGSASSARRPTIELTCGRGGAG